MTERRSRQPALARREDGVLRAGRPIRWAVATTVLGALVGLLIVGFGSSAAFDQGMVVILSFGALGGAVGGIRFFLLPWGDAADPRLGGTFDEGPVWSGYGKAAVDYFAALAVWLIGSVVVAIVGFIDNPRDSTILWVFPIVLGLIWSVAYAIAAMAMALIAIPVVILVRAVRARSRGERFSPWWYYLAVYLLVLVGSVASLALLLVLAPQLLDGYGKGDLFVLIFATDASTLTIAQAITLWVTRVLVALMFVLVVVTAALGARRLRALGRALRDAAPLP